MQVEERDIQGGNTAHENPTRKRAGIEIIESITSVKVAVTVTAEGDLGKTSEILLLNKEEFLERNAKLEACRRMKEALIQKIEDKWNNEQQIKELGSKILGQFSFTEGKY